MYPVYQAVLKALATPPEEEVPYYQASCSTGICTWPPFTSLALCVDTNSESSWMLSKSRVFSYQPNHRIANHFRTRCDGPTHHRARQRVEL